MHTVAFVLMLALGANAMVAFSIAFFWQAKAIFTIFRASGWTNANAPWKPLGNQNSPQNTFGHFIAGTIFPELRRKWLKAITYVVISYLSLFVIAGLITILAPEHLKNPASLKATE